MTDFGARSRLRSADVLAALSPRESAVADIILRYHLDRPPSNAPGRGTTPLTAGTADTLPYLGAPDLPAEEDMITTGLITGAAGVVKAGIGVVARNVVRPAISAASQAAVRAAYMASAKSLGLRAWGRSRLGQTPEEVGRWAVSQRNHLKVIARQFSPPAAVRDM